LKRGKRSGGQKNGGCQTRNQDYERWKRGGLRWRKEGRVGDFRELDRSANKHEFSLGWVKGEKVRRHPVGNVREKENVVRILNILNTRAAHHIWSGHYGGPQMVCPPPIQRRQEV
jgi:hypothetical protein